MPRRDDVRQFQVKPATETANGWKVYEVQMSGRKTKGVFDPNSWKAITGDVDLLGILHLDGSRDRHRRRQGEEVADLRGVAGDPRHPARRDDERRSTSTTAPSGCGQYGDELAVVDPTHGAARQGDRRRDDRSRQPEREVHRDAGGRLRSAEDDVRPHRRCPTGAAVRLPQGSLGHAAEFVVVRCTASSTSSSRSARCASC